MTQSFDDFKKYHNANYHDGSSHFDEQIYKKSNGDDFDCSFIQDCYDHFEAGAASKQDEIDDLIIQLADMKSRLNDNYTAGQTAMYKTKQIEINELQKRINDAVKCMEQNKPSFPMDFKHAMDALSILKGKQND